MVERCIKFNCKIIRFQKVGIISLITRITTYNLYYSYISNRLQELFPNYFPMNLFRFILYTLHYYISLVSQSKLSLLHDSFNIYLTLDENEINCVHPILIFILYFPFCILYFSKNIIQILYNP